MKTLVERVGRSRSLKELVEKLERGDACIDVAGLKGASLAFITSSLAELTGRRILVCLPDEEEAEDFLSDLNTVSRTASLLFPEKGILPGDVSLSERAKLRGARNRCLDRIRKNGVDVVVTSLLGFVEKTIAVSTLEKSRIDLNTGGALDFENLTEKLRANGYEFVSFVEEPGEFAVRGGIVDVFDPSMEKPIRIEVEDDRVESIRTFDIDAQVSLEKLDEASILPATAVVLESETLSQMEEDLLGRGFSSGQVKDIREEIEHNHSLWILNRYAPAMGMNGSLMDYFVEPPILIMSDFNRLTEEYEKREAAASEKQRGSTNGYPYLGFDSYVHAFRHFEEYEHQLIKVHRLTGNKGEAINFATESHPNVLGKIDELARVIRKLRSRGVDVFIFSESQAQSNRLADVLDEHEREVHLPVGWITSGFIWDEISMAVLTDHEIFHRILPRPRRRARRRRPPGAGVESLSVGDFVVHVDFGIGRYVGLEKLKADGSTSECLAIRYQGGDMIYVPVGQMYLVEKYVGKEGVAPAVDRLGSGKWQRTKERTRRALEEVARELLALYAEREAADGYAFSRDGQWQKALEAAFPYEETPDQLRTTEEVKLDMESSRPMDRLICGDVGYGKTEVAIRAAFKAVNDGKQVAVLVPTTILALQHMRTFKERMESYPVRIEMLSRFRSQSEQKVVVEGLREGTVDIVIGTHRLLSEDVSFRDLGLLIVDEEHRFGVRGKEKLKSLRKGVDVISLTATPIPRTLYMALSGLRRISLIETPPRNRHPVKTRILPFDEEVIAEAVMNELRREGQVFFVHNRVASIYSIQAFLEKLLPGVRFGVAHGQMAERELEKVILSFIEGSFDVLISTMIIESGLDFPNVNTIIINRADRFGLAQLYQLRGRVGRRERQAFAYLLVPRYLHLTRSAVKRLEAMEEFEELGSGYRLAMRDLEIRGAGNVLGVEQHGHMVAVGFEMYCKMLREAVDRLKGRKREAKPPCRVEALFTYLLPEYYVEDQDERMRLYRRLAGYEKLQEVDALEAELEDRFGPIPVETRNLLEATRLKLLGTGLGIAKIRFAGRRVIIEFLPGQSLRKEQCGALVETFHGELLFKSGRRFEIEVQIGRSEDGLRKVRKLLQKASNCDKKVSYTE